MQSEHLPIQPKSINLPNEKALSKQTSLDMRLLFICHGEGMQSRYSNFSDGNGGLTALGWEQANALSQWLRAYEQIEVLVSDTQRQSRLTAQRAGQEIELPLVVHPGLPNEPFEDWDISIPESEESPSLFDLQSRPQLTENGNYEAFRRRLIGALDPLLQSYWGQTIALVTGPKTIATLIRHFFGTHTVCIQIDHTSITEINLKDNQWYLAYLNRRQHLPDQPTTLFHTTPETTETESQEEDDLSLITQVYNRIAQANLVQKAQDDLQRIRHFLDFATIPSDLSVVDVGTGSGLSALMLAEDGADEVVGIDISPAMLEQAEYLRLSSPLLSARRVSHRLTPAQLTPFADERFSVAICRLVLHQTRHPERLLTEIFRILKPKGTLLCADLLSTAGAVKQATQNAIEERCNPCHVAVRNAKQYRTLFTKAGFTIQEEEEAVFERELEEWLDAMQVPPANRAIVQEMLEAGLETDAAGINARRQGNSIIFEQRLFYIKAMKP